MRFKLIALAIFATALNCAPNVQRVQSSRQSNEAQAVQISMPGFTNAMMGSATQPFKIGSDSVTIDPGFSRLRVNGVSNVHNAVGWVGITGNAMQPDAIAGAYSGAAGSRAFYAVQPSGNLAPSGPGQLTNLWTGVIQESIPLQWMVYESNGQLAVDAAGNFNADINGYILNGRINATLVQGTVQRGTMRGTFSGYYGTAGNVRSYGAFSATNGNDSIAGLWRN